MKKRILLTPLFLIFGSLLTSCDINPKYEYISRSNETSTVVGIERNYYDEFIKQPYIFFEETDFKEVCIIEKDNYSKYLKALLVFENKEICEKEKISLKNDNRINNVYESFNTPFSKVNTVSFDSNKTVFELGETIGLRIIGEYSRYVPDPYISYGTVVFKTNKNNAKDILNNVNNVTGKSLSMIDIGEDQDLKTYSLSTYNENDVENDFFLQLSIANYLSSMKMIEYVSLSYGSIATSPSEAGIWFSDFGGVEFDNFANRPGKYDDNFEFLKTNLEDGFIGNVTFKEVGDLTIKYKPYGAAEKEACILRINVTERSKD